VAQLLVDASDPATYQAAAGLLSLPLEFRDGLEARPLGSRTFAIRPFYNPERKTSMP